MARNREATHNLRSPVDATLGNLHSSLFDRAVPRGAWHLSGTKKAILLAPSLLQIKESLNWLLNAAVFEPMKGRGGGKWSQRATTPASLPLDFRPCTTSSIITYKVAP